MLVKRFVPKALMQQNQHSSMLDDIAEVVLRLGYFLLNPGFCSPVAGVSSEQVFWINFLFYNKEKMELKERMVADKLTVAVQEALIRGGVYDVRGFGSKIQYSKLYGCSFSWCDIPEVKVKYKTIDDKYFDYSSYLKIYPTSSQLTKLDSHDYYLKELNQDIVKVGKFLLLKPTLRNGWLVYQLLDLNYNPRFDFTSFSKMNNCLKLKRGNNIPLMANLSIPKIYHTLITGVTGFGKTELAFALSAELGQFCIEYYLDPKHSDLSSFGKFLGDDRYADNTEAIDDKLVELVEIMNKRYRIMSKMADLEPRKYIGASADKYGFKPIVIFFDEVSAYLSSSRKGIKSLKKLLMLGRQASVFVVLLLQDPRATDNLPSTIKDQTGVRILLGNLDRNLAGLVFGSKTELPDIERDVGQGYLQINKGEVKMFDAPIMPTDSEKLYDFMEQSLKGQKELDPLQHS